MSIAARPKRIQRKRVKGWKIPIDVDRVKAELSGKDLACWCPLDQPCPRGKQPKRGFKSLDSDHG
jgi:hypothetical protein